jgi:SagB-type dehydrogenase family enzyme
VKRDDPRTYDELEMAGRWPLSRLFHDSTKLTELRALELKESIASFVDPEEERTAHAHADGSSIALPRAKRRLFGPRLDDALRDRRSQREPFSGEAIDRAELGALLDLSAGVTGGSARLRAWPSAGALHPIDLHALVLVGAGLERGAYKYDPGCHALVRGPTGRGQELEGDLLRRTILADTVGGGAALAVVLTAVFERTQAKYGERGYRFVLLEAGHAAQNLLLVAQSMGLAAAPIGGFCEDALARTLGVDPAKESPVHVVLFGKPSRPAASR